MKFKLKYIKSLIIGLFLIVLTELSIYLIIGKKKIISASIENVFFDNKFFKKDVGQKYLISYKNKIFKNSIAEIVQIGDSSGLYGVQPNIIQNYLNGMDYINLSCCADTGWDGYVYTANYYLKNNENAKYLVLYVTPYSMPMGFRKGFSNDLKKIFGDSNSLIDFSFFNYLPSSYFRKNILNYIYKNKKNIKGSEYRMVMNHLGVAKDFEKITGFSDNEFYKFINFSKGWLPYDKKKSKLSKMPIKECGKGIIDKFYDQRGKGTLKSSLKKLVKVSNNYDVQLIILFNPVACSKSNQIMPIIKELNAFKNENPEVLIPFEFISTLDKDKFADSAHLTYEESIYNSHKIGKFFLKYLKL